MKSEEKNKEFRERLLTFSVDILSLLKTLPYRKEYDVLRHQLSRSATSIGANYEEAQNSTYKEFIHRVKIALREALETKYWLAIIDRMDISNKHQCARLIDEAKQISLILGSIASKADKKERGAE